MRAGPSRAGWRSSKLAPGASLTTDPETGERVLACHNGHRVALRP